LLPMNYIGTGIAKKVRTTITHPTGLPSRCLLSALSVWAFHFPYPWCISFVMYNFHRALTPCYGAVVQLGAFVVPTTKAADGTEVPATVGGEHENFVIPYIFI